MEEPPMLSAHDVAHELRQRQPQAGDVKNHKLVYYCQGWHVAWTGEPMFPEPIEAWANGPVVADLWHDEKRNRARPQAQQPDDEQLGIIDYVIGRYGRYTGPELVRKTHLEDPWRDASESEDSSGTENPAITHDALRAWFSQDEEYLAHRAAVARLRERRNIYGFEGSAMPDDLCEATLRILGESGPQLTAR
jgi:uncharacterized phage-associated protein